MSDSVVEYLGKGDFLFANPSSIHSSGKRSKRAINEVKDFIYQLFSLSESEWEIVFHSGASEGINSVFKGFGIEYFGHTSVSALVAQSDHSAVYEQSSFLKKLGHNFHTYEVNTNGSIDFQSLERLAEESDINERPILFNYTWVNNETGIVWDLEQLKKIRSIFSNCPKLIIHVDAVQSVGKIPGWNSIVSEADIYTFSGHKFGAMKGVGLSLMKKDLRPYPLIQGGGQQLGIRAGTENTDGIYSLMLAFKDTQKYEIEQMRTYRDKIESEIIKHYQDSSYIVGHGVKNRNFSTLSIAMKETTADILLTAFDLAGMDVSSGSACSSGTVSPSRVLLAMGYSHQEARSALRISLGPKSFDYNSLSTDALSHRVIRVLGRFK